MPNLLPLTSHILEWMQQYICPKEAGLLVNERPERVRALPEGDDTSGKITG